MPEKPVTDHAPPESAPPNSVRSNSVRPDPIRPDPVRSDPVWSDPDDAPDLSTPEWAAIIDAAPVRRGRPAAAAAKVSTTIRLDPDVIAAFRAGGPGWQSRINAALRKAAGLG